MQLETDDDDVVIGLINVPDRAPGAMAWMIPLEKVVSYLPALRERLGRREADFLMPGQELISGTLERRIRQRRAGVSASLEHDELLRMLIPMEAIMNRASRDGIIRELVQFMGSFFSVPRYERSIEDISSLIVACLGQPGALHALLDLLRRRTSAPVMRELEAAVSRFIPEPLLTREERQTLYDTMREIDFEAATYFYRQAVGPFGRPLSPDASDAISIARALEGLSKPPNGLPHLIVFAESVAHFTEHGKAERIREWVDAHLERTNLPGRLIVPLRMKYANSKTPASGACYLVIRLKQDDVKGGLYQMEAWLQYQESWEPLIDADGRLFNLIEISDGMDYLLHEVRQLMLHDPDPTVEFILPRHLLSLAVDAWEVGGVLPRRLGESYPVVVRSMERMDNGSIHPQWQRKWNWVTVNGDQADPFAISWLWERDARPAEQLRSDLSNEYGRPACLALGYRPSGGNLGFDEISIGLSAGMPIVVWCRQEYERDFLEDELNELLASRGLLQLPQHVRDYRSAAVTYGTFRTSQPEPSDAHPRRHLTLLYDDASRVPVTSTPIHAPGQRR